MRRTREKGQATLLVLLASSIFVIGALGLAIDGAQLYAHRQMAQTAADAAAQAGIISIFHGTNTASTYPINPYICTSTDLITPCRYAALNGFVPSTGGDTVLVRFGNRTSSFAPAGVSLPSNSVSWMTVTVIRNVHTTLMQLVGAAASLPIKATATAAVLSPSLNCITALSPSGTGLSIVGNATLNLTTCGIAVDSSASNALTATGNITATAGSIDVVGGYSPTGPVSVNPIPTTGSPTAADPLADVWPPTPGTCTSYTGTTTLNPGTYCGGINLSGNTNITFSSGTYILVGGGLHVSGNTTLSGTGVTFYNTFNGTYPYSPISITGNGSINLSAPSSGPLQGILFFQDRNTPTGSTESFTGNSNQTFAGALYFPRSTLSYTGNSGTVAQNLAIVADKVTFTGNTSLTVNPTLASSGAPVAFKVALVK